MGILRGNQEGKINCRVPRARDTPKKTQWTRGLWGRRTCLGSVFQVTREGGRASTKTRELRGRAAGYAIQRKKVTAAWEKEKKMQRESVTKTAERSVLEDKGKPTAKSSSGRKWKRNDCADPTSRHLTPEEWKLRTDSFIRKRRKETTSQVSR